jgi:hypothetical protein
MMGSNNHYSNDSPAFFSHYKDGRWSLWPQTFPGGDIAVFDMLSPTDGWASHYGRGHWELLHFDGSTWAPVDLPVLLPYGNIPLAGPVLQVNSGTTWFRTVGAGGIYPPLEQYANGKWQQVSWPFSTAAPGTIVTTSDGDVWGVGDTDHREGCGPALVALVAQGVFFHLHQGHWTEQVLP